MRYFTCVKSALVFTCLLAGFKTHAQNNEIDSLLTLSKKAKQDTVKIQTWLSIAFIYADFSPDSAITYAKKAKELAQKTGNRKLEAYALSELGWDTYRKGDFSLSLTYFTKAIQLDNALNDKVGLASDLGNMGIVYKDQADYSRALNYFFKSLKIHEELNNAPQIATLFGNIGNVYRHERNFKKALEFYQKAYKLDLKLNNKLGVTRHLGNIGNVYLQQINFETAMRYYKQALEFAKALGDKHELAKIYGNMGIIYKDLKEYPTALENLSKAYEFDKTLKNKAGMSAHKANMGRVYLASGKTLLGQQLMNEALFIADSINMLEGVKEICFDLSNSYAQSGDYDKAFSYYRHYVTATDSISNDENTKAQVRAEIRYELDKKQATDSIQNAEREKMRVLKRAQEINQQKLYTYWGLGLFIIMFFLALISYRAFKNKQKANEIINGQKRLVEEKQKEILDSIHYAKRIQRAILPNDKYIDRTIKTLTKHK